MKQEIDEYCFNLKETGFKIRAVISDDHSANTNAFSHLLKVCDGDKRYYTYHPVCRRLLKIYVFFDNVHSIENIRNNLVNRKKFVFPT